MVLPVSYTHLDVYKRQDQSNENPVYYVQYAHARICSILARLGEENISSKRCAEIPLERLEQPEELELIETLAKYPEELRQASETYDPTRLTRYTVELAGAFHTFYNACRVKCEQEDLMYARLKLVEMVKSTIASSLGLLGVTAPEKM